MKYRSLILSLAVFLSYSSLAADRPNILWITAEDMSPVLGCYGDKDAITPHLNTFSERSVLYTHAFATAPVCSPSRSCLINGLSATSQGTHNMRSAFPIPAYMKGFPSLLKAKGYFTSNNVKTDYNSANWQNIIKASWSSQGDNAHWRQRPDGQPFFSILI
ncbi:MAG: sulfatase-like hydrolase/transferase [Lentisphaerales bacterium]|nr:sulfatase-like hydrolase/transferase [Lentisphaerales bacterium]